MADPSKYPTRLAPYGLRIPPDLKARLETSAKANGRTLHAEIINALEYLYPAPTPISAFRDELREALHDMVDPDADPQEAIDTVQWLLSSKLDDVIEGEVEKRLARRPKPQADVRDDDMPF